MWQTILTIFYIVWLCAVLVLLWLIWRNQSHYMRRTEQTYISVTLKAVDAAVQAAEAARRVAESMRHAD